MTKRKFLTREQKIAIVREHLLEGVPVSALVDKHKIHAVQFYQWQKLLFEEGAVACIATTVFPHPHCLNKMDTALPQPNGYRTILVASIERYQNRGVRNGNASKSRDG